MKPSRVIARLPLYGALLALLVVVAGAYIYFGRGRVTPAPQVVTEVKRGGTVILAFQVAPKNLNPLLSKGVGDSTIYPTIFDGLTALDENLTPTPALAKDWSVSADGLQWTFHLRTGVKWHDGADFTAEDVKFTFDKVLDPNVNSPQRSSFAKIVDSVEVLDATTVSIRTSRPFGPLLTLLGSWQGLKIVPKHALEQEQNLAESSFNRKPIGTGPFRFVGWSSDDVITLERFDKFWGGAVPNVPGTPYIDSLIIKTVPDQNVLNAQLRSGEVTIGLISQSDIIAMRKAPNIHIVEMPSIILTYFAVNPRNPLFKDTRVRKAVMYGIDREGIVKAALQGLGQVADSPIFPRSWAYNPAIAGKYSYDPERAQQLLREAGWVEKNTAGILVKDGKRFEFTLQQYSEWPPYVNAAQIIQDKLRALGINVKLEIYEYNAWFSRFLSVGNYGGAIFALLSTDPDLSQSLGCDVQPPKGQNWFFYCSDTADNLLKQGLESVNIEDRKKAYFKLQEVLAEDVPLIPLFSETLPIGISKDLMNFRYNAERFTPFLYTVWLSK